MTEETADVTISRIVESLMPIDNPFEIGAILIDVAHRLGMALTVFTGEELNGRDAEDIELAMIVAGNTEIMP